MAFKEAAICLNNMDILDLQVGTPGQVEFDFIKIMDKYRKCTDPNKHLLFIHSHPYGFGSAASATDYNCMKGLFVGLGKPFSFMIYELCPGAEPTMQQHTLYEVTSMEDIQVRAGVRVDSYYVGILYGLSYYDAVDAE